MISDGLWQRAFHRDPGVLGRSINLHNQLYNVVGVMPPQMSSPSGVDVWVPIMRRPPVPGRIGRIIPVFSPGDG